MKFLFVFSLVFYSFIVQAEITEETTPAISTKAYATAKKTKKENACLYSSSGGKWHFTQQIALTFDDGPHPIWTPKILDVLAKHNIKATFFVVGSHAKMYPKIMERIKEEGHLIGNHSFSHPNFHTISEKAQLEELLQTDETISAYTPISSLFFRYPYGNSTCFSNEVLKKHQYKVMGWHVDSCDWAFKNGVFSEQYMAICGVEEQNSHSLLNHLLKEIEDEQGGIVLMHDVHPAAAQTLGPLIFELTKQGYHFMTPQ